MISQSAQWRQAGHRYGRICTDFAGSDKLCWLIQTREVGAGERKEGLSLSVFLSVGINLLFDSGLDHKLTPWSKVKLLLLPPLSPSVLSTGDSLPSSPFFPLPLLLLLLLTFLLSYPIDTVSLFSFLFSLVLFPVLISSYFSSHMPLFSLLSFSPLISVPLPPHFLFFSSQFWFLLTNEMVINFFK